MMQLRQAVVTEYTLCSDEEWKMVDGKLGKKNENGVIEIVRQIKKNWVPNRIWTQNLSDTSWSLYPLPVRRNSLVSNLLLLANEACVMTDFQCTTVIYYRE